MFDNLLAIVNIFLHVLTNVWHLLTNVWTVFFSNYLDNYLSNYLSNYLIDYLSHYLSNYRTSGHPVLDRLGPERPCYLSWTCLSLPGALSRARCALCSGWRRRRNDISAASTSLAVLTMSAPGHLGQKRKSWKFHVNHKSSRNNDLSN